MIRRVFIRINKKDRLNPIGFGFKRPVKAQLKVEITDVRQNTVEIGVLLTYGAGRLYIPFGTFAAGALADNGRGARDIRRIARAVDRGLSMTLVRLNGHLDVHYSVVPEPPDGEARRAPATPPQMTGRRVILIPPEFRQLIR